MTLRLLLVDDHRIFREALCGLLERNAKISVVGEAANGQEAIAMARELVPDIVCMDIAMPGINGIAATRELRAACPDVKVIALSTHADHVYVMDMLAAGASAYVTKAEGGKELLRAIEAVANGHQYPRCRHHQHSDPGAGQAACGSKTPVAWRPGAAGALPGRHGLELAADRRTIGHRRGHGRRASAQHLAQARPAQRSRSGSLRDHQRPDLILAGRSDSAR
jgi:DNA-binding NarL/FixJ family response regulator